MVVAEVAPEPPTPSYTPIEGDRFTIWDLFELPRERFRYEVLAGMLAVSPWPVVDHQDARDELRELLKHAAPKGAKVSTDTVIWLNSDENAVVPDVVVTRPGIKRRGRSFFEARDVLAVVEIVSPGSVGADRAIKPRLYADAGIPCFWRVELRRFRGMPSGERPPVVLVHELDEESGSYRLAERLAAGTTGHVTLPFPVDFDPADLLPPDD